MQIEEDYQLTFKNFKNFYHFILLDIIKKNKNIFYYIVLSNYYINILYLIIINNLT